MEGKLALAAASGDRYYTPLGRTGLARLGRPDNCLQLKFRPFPHDFGREGRLAKVRVFAGNWTIQLARLVLRPKKPHKFHHLRVFLARRTRVARILVSTPRMVEKLLVTLGARSAW